VVIRHSAPGTTSPITLWLSPGDPVRQAIERLGFEVKAEAEPIQRIWWEE
jgi:hypothetical protein